MYINVGGVCAARKELKVPLQCIGSAASIAAQGAPKTALYYTQGA